MPKGTSTRFRNRKINFKTRIAVISGSLDLAHDDAPDHGIVADGHGDGEGSGRVETGVDKEEESEHHLQVAISASAASLQNRSSTSASLKGSVSGGSPSKAPVPYIPTPDAAGVVKGWEKLYPPNKFHDPKGYIRFSETVEDCISGAGGYTMDEEDDEWLRGWNAQFSEDASPTKGGANGTHANGVSNGDSGRGGRSGTRNKGKEPMLGPISEDDFELVMEQFETATESLAPALHTDTSRIPTLPDLEATFNSTPTAPKLGALKIFAKVIYPHWKERRLKCDGHSIIPQLDYDESNESNPYVCFRRRELKIVRKTRRTDAQNVERLARLKADLAGAQDLLRKVVDREHLKRDSLHSDKAVFDGRILLRELKRKAGEAMGDEELLVGKREKKKDKREQREPPVGLGPIRIPLKKSTGASPLDLNAPAAIAQVDALAQHIERAAIAFRRMDNDLARKREADSGWEDWTDGAYHPLSQSTPAKYFRDVESASALGFPVNFGNDGGDVLTFSPHHHIGITGSRRSFRKRIGRGGRILLDRIPSHADRRRDRDPEESDEERAREVESRWKFDSDATVYFPSAEAPEILDDYAPEYGASRIGLARPLDEDVLRVDPTHLEEAMKWADREPERPPPVQVVGKLTSRPVAIPQAAVNGLQPGMGLGPTPPAPSPSSSAALAGQMVAAANHAHHLAQAQAQAQLRRTITKPNGSPGPMVRATPVPSPIPGGAVPVNGAGLPPGGTWPTPNGFVGMPQQKMEIPAGFHVGPNNQVFSQFPQANLPNGLHLARSHVQNMPQNGLGLGSIAVGSPSLPNGANGLPATSRLSQPPFSNPVVSPSGLPASQHNLPNGHLQQPPPNNNHFRPSSQNSEHRSPSIGHPAQGQAMPSPRPSSAASSHHSPGLPPQQVPAGQGSPMQAPVTRQKRMPPGTLNLAGFSGPAAAAAAAAMVNGGMKMNGNAQFMQAFQHQPQQS